jgi:Uma2 family endonuclease
MLVPNKAKYTYEEFLQITKDMDRAEFIDGEIILQATPTADHQRILGRLFIALTNYFKGSKCEPFMAPFNVILRENDEDIKRVQPDLFIICDEKLYTENQYEGVPPLIIEIVSPSNASDDYIRKPNLYMKFGVKEYWIVSPKNRTIEVFSLEEGVYGEPTIYFKDKTLKSALFEELQINLAEVF